jgi:hypothetical protein
MQQTRTQAPTVDAVIGYAAGERGNGVAYARLAGDGIERLLRVAFHVGAALPPGDRAIAYAALTAISRALGKRGFQRVHFTLGDRAFAEEIATGRGVSEARALQYVRLRCLLNSLTQFEVRAGCADELTQRAQAEVALNVAA